MAESVQPENLSVEYADDQCRIILQSTSKFNAINQAMAKELVEVAGMLAEDSAIRCIVVTGSDDVFCAGADLTELAGDESDATTMRRLATQLHTAIRYLHRSGTPIICGVNGVAAGAGFGLAVAGDLVIMRDDARLEYVYPRIGLTGDGGSTFFLPRLVGHRRATEIVLLDDPIDAPRAVDLGLATETVPESEFESRLSAVASRIANGPTTAYRRTKRLLDQSWSRTIEGQLAAETETVARSARSNDYQEGYEAFFSDREPSFTGN